MDPAQPALYPYAQRAQMASNIPESGPAQFQAMWPDEDSHNYLVQKFGDKYIHLIHRYGAAEMISDEEVRLWITLPCISLTPPTPG
jgi:hypothetical protein